MNRILAVTLVCMLFAVEGFAEFTMPKKVYRMNQFNEAKAEAASKRKAFTFIYTDEKTSCGLCKNASLNAVEHLDNKTVVVYAHCNTDWNLLPKIVQEALNKPEAGQYIPQTVIVDVGLTNVLAIVPYARGEEHIRLLNEAKNLLDERSKSSASQGSMFSSGGSRLNTDAQVHKKKIEKMSLEQQVQESTHIFVGVVQDAFIIDKDGNKLKKIRNNQGQSEGILLNMEVREWLYPRYPELDKTGKYDTKTISLRIYGGDFSKESYKSGMFKKSHIYFGRSIEEKKEKQGIPELLEAVNDWYCSGDFEESNKVRGLIEVKRSD